MCINHHPNNEVSSSKFEESVETVLRRVPRYCVLKYLNLLNISFCVYNQEDIFSIFLDGWRNIFSLHGIVVNN